MEVNKSEYNSSFANSYFGSKGVDNRVVTGGASGNKIESEGDKSVFGTDEELGKQQFLELLVTQLKYQDPLNPSNDQEFIAQLAQFSSLESSQNIESEMSTLASSLEGFIEKQDSGVKSLTNSSASGLLGKYALIENEDFYHPGSESSFRIFKEGNSAVLAKITDSKGDLVYSEPITGLAGYGEFVWNGLTSEGDQAKPGDYRINIVDPSTSEEKGFAFVEDYISAITYEDGTPLVNVNGENYRLEDIKQILEISE